MIEADIVDIVYQPFGFKFNKSRRHGR
jgi:hypothetical protein